MHYGTLLTPTRIHSPRQARALLVMMLLVLPIAACQEAAPPDPKLGILTSGADSLATATEIRASLAGEHAPGAEAYSYRGLYAGIDQARLDALPAASRADSTQCAPAPKIAGELLCSRHVLLGDDRADVRLDIIYVAPARTGVRVARELTVTRALPLDVDGVRVAAALADAFEQQTKLLDSRDATYGRHTAHIRMGTLNGARAHFAEVTVATHAGREELTVRMGRGAGR